MSPISRQVVTRRRWRRVVTVKTIMRTNEGQVAARLPEPPW